MLVGNGIHKLPQVVVYQRMLLVENKNGDRIFSSNDAGLAGRVGWGLS